jgi:hypothetical protein
MDDGELVVQTSGVIKVAFARKAGEGEKGPWSVQHFVLQDGNAEIKVKAWNKDDVLPLKGKKVALLCGKDGHGKLSGLAITEEEYQGKTSKILELNTRGELVRYDAPQEAPEASPDDGDLGPQPSKEPAQRTPTAKPDAKWIPMGPTVGMAINNACANLTARGLELEPAAVYNVASDLLRVSQRLEGGKLAAPYSERKPSAPKPAVNDPCPACGQEQAEGVCINDHCERSKVPF